MARTARAGLANSEMGIAALRAINEMETMYEAARGVFISTLPEHRPGRSRIQELWANWWREPAFDRVTGEWLDRLPKERWALLDGKERRNFIRAIIEAGAVIALENAPQAGDGSPIPGAHDG